MRIKEESLDRALEAAGLQQLGLPKQYKDGKDGFWIRALVLVQKRSLEECYCIYQQNADRYMRLLQDFGTPSPIMCVKSIHPYMYLDEAQLVPGGCLEAKRDSLRREMGDAPRAAEIDDMSEGEVVRSLLALAIDRQLRCEEGNRVMNVRNEGSDLDGTRNADVERRQFEAELEQMRKEGCSKAEIKAFMDAFEHRHDNEGDGGLGYVPEDERLRMEMESLDVQKAQAAEFSVDGEFDEKEIDYAALKEVSDQYRKDILRQQKRRWKREFDSGKEIRAGFSCENEFGEKEEIETLQVASMERAEKKWVAKDEESVKDEELSASSDAVLDAENKIDAEGDFGAVKNESKVAKKKPGRPKKQVRAGVTKRKNNAAKRAAAAKGEEV